MTGYFDIESQSTYGFTMRIHYEELMGIVSITNIQLKSTVYTGPKWFPNGTIKVDDVDIFTMNHNEPATHKFDVTGASDRWIDIVAIGDSQELPAKSAQILDKTSTTISAEIRLYRDADTDRPTLSGSTIIELTTGFIYIDNGDKFEPYIAYIDNGQSWDRYIPYIDNGSTWDMVG